MSVAIRASHAHQLKKSKAALALASKEQAELFVDPDNSTLSKPVTTQGQETEVDDQKKKGRCDCNLTPFILMIALSVHAMFEGIALGIMTNFGSVMNLMISVLIHKAAEAMSISIAL